MTNIEKLDYLGILGDVRQRLGADTEADIINDDIINKMSNTELVKHWAGWKLGDGSWWLIMKSYFDQLENL